MAKQKYDCNHRCPYKKCIWNESSESVSEAETFYDSCEYYDPGVDMSNLTNDEVDVLIDLRRIEYNIEWNDYISEQCW